MTIKELIEHLNHFPENTEVLLNINHSDRDSDLEITAITVLPLSDVVVLGNYS